MNFFEALILGIIQGITEFLPISSDGHLVITQEFFGLNKGGNSLLFDVFLHIGTLIAVFIAFRKTILNLIIEFFALVARLFTGKYTYKKSTQYQKMIVLILVSLLPLVLVVLFKKTIEGLFTSTIAAGVGFLITAVFLYLADRAVKGNKNASNTKPREAFLIGLFQSLATLPGVSRSGTTVSTGLMLGLSREFAVEFSFIMSIPAIIGATLLSFKDAFESKADLSNMFPFFVGAVVAAIVGFFAIKLLKYLVKNDKFKIFAYYTTALGIITIIASFVFHK